MPRHSQVKTKKVVDDDIADMFHNMISEDSVNLEYAWPRYGRLHAIAKKLLALASLLSVSGPLVENFPEAAKLIDSWVKGREADVRVAFSVDFIKPSERIPGVVQYDHINEVDVKRFKANYDAARNCAIFRAGLKWLEQLEQYAVYIDVDPNTLQPGQPKPNTFVNTMVDSWYPLDPLHVDFRYIIQNSDEAGKDLIMRLLRVSLTTCRDLDKELKEPDINVPQFVAVITEAIDKLKKIPELSRCQQAFAKIKKSVGLLETNFGSYYADFLETQDSTIIMQNFVADVALKTQADPQTTGQFRRIMMYYKKLAGEQGKKDPKINKLLATLDTKFQAIPGGDEKLEEEPQASSSAPQ